MIDVGQTARAEAAIHLMASSDRYYVIFEPVDDADPEPYCLYDGDKADSNMFVSSIIRLSFQEVRWIMSERIKQLGGESSR
jgi:hypothetical protein